MEGLEDHDKETTTLLLSPRRWREQWIWNTLLPLSCRDYENAPRWTNLERLDLLQQGSDKKRFQYCLNSHSLILYMRAIQVHSGWTKVDPTLLDNVQILYKWSEYFHHSGYTHSITQSGLIARGKDAKEYKRYSSPPWIPWVMSQRKSTKTCQNHER